MLLLVEIFVSVIVGVVVGGVGVVVGGIDAVLVFFCWCCCVVGGVIWCCWVFF